MPKGIENWRFTKHMPSRASAIRELLQRGLAGESFKLAATGKRSASFGVLEGWENLWFRILKTLAKSYLHTMVA
jgi:hypothetical protein